MLPCSGVLAGRKSFAIAFSFLILSWLNVSAVDVSYFAVVKSEEFQQTDNAAPVPITNAFGFNALVVADTNGVVTNATLTVSTGSGPWALSPADTNGVLWRYENHFASEAALEAAFPSGVFYNPVSYTLKMYGRNDGLRSASLSFFFAFLKLTYPVTPQISNFSAAHNIDTTRDFELRWNNLGGSSIAIVQLTVMDSSSNLLYMSGLPFQPGALTGMSTSCVIPAGALTPGTNFIGRLSIGNPGMPNTNSYPGASGFPVVGKDTMFPLRTRSVPVQPSIQAQRLDAGSLTLVVTGEADRYYQLQATTNLQTWTNFFSTNLAVDSFSVSVPQGSSNTFYRVKVGD